MEETRLTFESVPVKAKRRSRRVSVWLCVLCAVLAADYALEIFDRLRGLRSRYVLAGMLAVCCFATGSLSIARECVSDYEMYSRGAVETAEYVENNPFPAWPGGISCAAPDCGCTGTATT